MAYLSILEFIDRFSMKELIRSANDRSSTIMQIDEAAFLLYLQGTNPSPTADMLLVETAFLRAEECAEDLANGYLFAATYTVPIPDADVPFVLKSKVADLARYELQTKTPTDAVKLRNEQAVDWLRDLVKGRVHLGLDAQDEVQDRSGGPQAVPMTETLDHSRVFTNVTLDRYLGGYEREE